MRIILLLLFILVLSSCSSYKMKVGKKCMDNGQGGQTWSRVWFVQKGVKFDEGV